MGRSGDLSQHPSRPAVAADEKGGEKGLQHPIGQKSVFRHGDIKFHHDLQQAVGAIEFQGVATAKFETAPQGRGQVGQRPQRAVDERQHQQRTGQKAGGCRIARQVEQEADERHDAEGGAALAEHDAVEKDGEACQKAVVPPRGVKEGGKGVQHRKNGAEGKSQGVVAEAAPKEKERKQEVEGEERFEIPVVAVLSAVGVKPQKQIVVERLAQRPVFEQKRQTDGCKIDGINAFQPMGIEGERRVLFVGERQPQPREEEEDVHPDVAHVEPPHGVVDPATEMKNEDEGDGHPHQIISMVEDAGQKGSAVPRRGGGFEILKKGHDDERKVFAKLRKSWKSALHPAAFLFMGRRKIYSLPCFFYLRDKKNYL